MNCPTCTALARLIHAGTYCCIHGHEFRQPRTAGVLTCLKCGTKPPRAGMKFCHQCEKRNARLSLCRRDQGPAGTLGQRISNFGPVKVRPAKKRKREART